MTTTARVVAASPGYLTLDCTTCASDPSWRYTRGMYPTRTVEGRRLAERDAAQHRCAEKAPAAEWLELPTFALAHGLVALEVQKWSGARGWRNGMAGDARLTRAELLALDELLASGDGYTGTVLGGGTVFLLTDDALARVRAWLAAEEKHDAERAAAEL